MKSRNIMEICNPRQWKTISTSVLEETGYPVYGANGVIGFYSDYNHENQTVLITCRGATCGEIHICESKSYVTGNAMALDDLSDEIDIRYLYYYLLDHDFKSIISGSAQPQITRQGLQKLIIKYPTIETQKKIVETLDKAQALIDARKEQIRLMDELVKSKFIEMFGDPITNPMRWKETIIGDSCYYVKDGPHVSPKYVSECEGIPFISVRNIINKTIDWSTAKYISEEDYFSYIKKCQPQKGDILYTKGGSTGIAKLIDTDIRFANWVHLAVLKFKEDLNGIFFENMLNSDYCYKQSQELTKGIANRDLVLGSMKQIKFYKPPIDLQDKFAEFVQQVDKYKHELQKSLDEINTTNQAMKQQYFA